MVGTILPVVYGERQHQRLPKTIWVHTLGCIFGAICLGVLLGGLGAIFQPGSTSSIRGISLFTVGFVGLFYALRELDLARVPAPQLQLQVPHGWRVLAPSRMAFLYGIGLGVGIATRIPVSSFYVVALWALLCGNAILGACVMFFFGLGRSIPLVWFGLRRLERLTDFRSLTRELSGWEPVVHVLNGLSLGFVSFSQITAGLVFG